MKPPYADKGAIQDGKHRYESVIWTRKLNIKLSKYERAYNTYKLYVWHKLLIIVIF